MALPAIVLCAAPDITLLLGALATTIAAFHHVDDRAAMLLAPYFVWVCYATYLNFSFCELNPKVRHAEQHKP